MRIAKGSRKAGRARARKAIDGMLAAAVLLASIPTIADASTGPHSRIKSICLRERVILRPEKKAAAVETETDGTPQRMRMIPISYCDLRRPGCFADEVEVSMTICKPPE